MTSATLPFTFDEYDDRVSRTRRAMELRGLDLIVVSDPSNMAWLTGYDGWSFYVHQAVVLGHEGAPIWWGRAMDGLGALRTVWMDPGHIVGYDDTYVQNTAKHPMETLATLINERFTGVERIGVEMDNYYYSAAAHAVLTAALPGIDLFDTTGVVNWQRSVKSAAEITFMRRAAAITDAMMATIREKAEPGMGKHELVAEIYATAIRGAGGHWGDYPAIVPMAPSGVDASAPHMTWDDRPLNVGEPTFFEISGVYRRYHAPQSRTLFFGTPPEKYRLAEAAVKEAVEAGLEMARPGNTCADIANAFNAVLNRLGFQKDSRCGYSIGLSYPPDWGERTMSFRRDDQTVLEAGMTFHFMPALWLDDGGIELTEPILITDYGADLLCSTPREMWVK